MAQGTLPLILEPEDLENRFNDDYLLIVDLSKREIYEQYHIPGAVHLEYEKIIGQRPPVTGLLPDIDALSQTLSLLGMHSECHVVAYDDEGGIKASRLLWTLDVIGHRHYSLLNGGLHAWVDNRRPITRRFTQCVPSPFQIRHYDDKPIAIAEYILEHLGDSSVSIVDARTPAEYRGEDKRAMRGGHIPGAVNIEWTSSIDPNHAMRLKQPDELRRIYETAGVTPDKTVICYCHSHRRSAHTYIVLKSLGYPAVKGYPGSWSDWGNRVDTPIEAAQAIW